MPRTKICGIAATVALVALTALAAGETSAMGALRVPSAGSLPKLPSAPSLPAARSVPSPQVLPTLPSAPSLPSNVTSPLLPPPVASQLPPLPLLPATLSPLPGPIPAVSRPSAPLVVAMQGPSESPLVAASGTPGLTGQASSVTRSRSAERLRATLTSLDGCFYVLTRLERRVLVLLAGLKRSRAYSPPEVAARLDISRRRVGRIERRGLRRLKRTARADGCGDGVSIASALSVSGGLPASLGIVSSPTAGREIPFAKTGRGANPFMPPLLDDLPAPAQARSIGSTWVIVALAIATLILFTIAGRELRKTPR